MLNAGAGLLPNPPADIGTALILDSNIQPAIDSYESVTIVDQFANILTTAANLVNITGTVYNTQVVYGGTGYDTMGVPNPEFLPAPTGLYAVAATGTVTVSGSAVNSVTMLDVGRGYEQSPEVFFVGGISGVGASAIAQIKYQPGPLTNQTFQDLATLGANIFPALNNVLPSAYPVANVSFQDPVQPWLASVVYATGDRVGQIVLPEYDPVISYVTADQVTFSDKSYEATANSQGVFPTDVNSWQEIDIPALTYQAVDTSKGVYPPGSSLWTADIGQYQFTQTILQNANAVLGQGDLSKFCQVFQSALAYRSQANQTINSCRNSAVLDQTFDPNSGGMETLTTGGVNQVTSDFGATGQDFSLLGNLINLANLDDLGLPGELLAQIGRITGGELAVVTEFLQAAGIADAKIAQLSRGNNTLTSEEEHTAYRAMTAVTGTTLEQILLLLRVRVAGVINMAQLLNPRLLLPTSWPYLLCPSGDGLTAVYLSDGAVNTNLRDTLLNVDIASYSGPNNTNSLETLEKIIPADQALANKALARSLSQIKNIAQTNLPQLSAATAAVTGNQGLELVQNQTRVVPPVVTETYETDLGTGTGPNGTLVLSDIIGVVQLGQYVDGLNQARELIQSVNVSQLAPIYTNIQGVLLGTYGAPYGPIVIPSGPAAGTYTDLEDALQVLIPLASAEIAVIAAANPDTVSATNEIWNAVCEDLERQTRNLELAQVDFNNLTANSSSSVMSFTASLHAYAVDAEAENTLADLANMTTLSGQSVLASLREGRNIQALQQAGVQLDTQLSDT